MAEIPTTDEIRTWLKVSTASTNDDQLEVIRAGELASQVRRCRMPIDWLEPDGYPADLALALYRRCGRALAARGVPLGVISTDEFGQSRLPSWDAEIERYERPWRKFAFG